MTRKQSVAALLLCIVSAAAVPAIGQSTETPPEQKLGIFVNLGLNYLGVRGTGLALGVRDDATVAGIQGEVVDANWTMRFDAEAGLGLRLPGRKGTLFLGFFQWDQNLDLFEKPGGNYVIGNTLSSPIPASLQGDWDEDLDNDGDVNGVDFRTLYITDGVGRELSTEPPGNPLDPNVLDSAEDLNNNGRNDLFSFSQSDLLKGRMSIDVEHLDLLYGRNLRETERFTLAWQAGIRLASVNQKLDLEYRNEDSFAVYVDDEASLRRQGGTTQQIDATCDRYQEAEEGDGWGNGNGSNVVVNGVRGQDTQIRDDLLTIPILASENIRAGVKTKGVGLRLALTGEYRLRKKLVLTSTLGYAALYGSSDAYMNADLYRERDAWENFFTFWDFNHDGKYDRSDFDFNGDTVVDQSDWSHPDAKIPFGGDPARGIAPARTGYRNSISTTCAGCPQNPYADGFLNEGDPVPESERNSTIFENRASLRDVSGQNAGRFFSTVDLSLGLRWDFSQVASITFGARGSRWMDVGTLRNVGSASNADDLTDGDLSMSGFFLTLTIWPKGGITR